MGVRSVNDIFFLLMLAYLEVIVDSWL